MKLDCRRVIQELCYLGVIILVMGPGTRSALDSLFSSAARPSWVELGLICAALLDKGGKHFNDRRGNFANRGMMSASRSLLI